MPPRMSCGPHHDELAVISGSRSTRQRTVAFVNQQKPEGGDSLASFVLGGSGRNAWLPVIQITNLNSEATETDRLEMESGGET